MTLKLLFHCKHPAESITECGPQKQPVWCLSKQAKFSPVWPKTTTLCLTSGPTHDLLLIQPVKKWEYIHYRCNQVVIIDCLNMGVKVQSVIRPLLGKEEKRNKVVCLGQNEGILNYQIYLCCHSLFLCSFITTFFFFSFFKQSQTKLSMWWL